MRARDGSSWTRQLDCSPFCEAGSPILVKRVRIFAPNGYSSDVTRNII